jgi:hypothetical protein
MKVHLTRMLLNDYISSHHLVVLGWHGLWRVEEALQGIVP